MADLVSDEDSLPGSWLLSFAITSQGRRGEGAHRKPLIRRETRS